MIYLLALLAAALRLWLCLATPEASLGGRRGRSLHGRSGSGPRHVHASSPAVESRHVRVERIHVGKERGERLRV